MPETILSRSSLDRDLPAGFAVCLAEQLHRAHLLP
jgi:hypothetical protein